MADFPVFLSFPLVYTLELSGGNYYVGWTTDLNRRLYEHFNGAGAKWTKEHKPIRVVSVSIGDKSLENEETRKLMELYGPDKVRGGNWCKVSSP